jgi:hypothetical protein
MTEGPANAMLHAALWYAELGYPVFPCAPGRKAPLTEHGLLEATTDAEQITEWWTQHSDANVAIRADGLVVIDIDGDGNAWLADEPDTISWPRSTPPRSRSRLAVDGITFSASPMAVHGATRPAGSPRTSIHAPTAATCSWLRPPRRVRPTPGRMSAS